MHIREGGIIANNQTYLLELVDEHNNTLFIQLSKNGEYWTINSAGIFRKKYSRNKRKVYDRPALGSDTNTDSSGVDSGNIDGVTTPTGNSTQTSDSKDTTISLITNELGEKSAVPSVQEQIQAAEAEVNTNPTEAPVKAETPTISQESEQISDQDNAPYTIAPAQYTTKKGKVLNMHLVKFTGTLTKEQQRAAKRRRVSSYLAILYPH